MAEEVPTRRDRQARGGRVKVGRSREGNRDTAGAFSMTFGADEGERVCSEESIGSFSQWRQLITEMNARQAADRGENET